MRSALFWGLVFAVGCGPYDPEHDAKVPGTLLGLYAVTGKLARDQCGAELLGAPNPWKFQVKLSKLANDLYWLNGREAIVGELASDGRSFSFATRVDVPLGRSGATAQDCLVSRFDTADGILEKAGESGARPAFRADLSFMYKARSEFECFEIIGVPGGVRSLPCELGYQLTGTLEHPTE